MAFTRLFILLLVSSVVSSVWCHHHHHHHHQHGFHSENTNGIDETDSSTRFGDDANQIFTGEGEMNRRSLNVEETKGVVPFSARRLEKMLEKAILKIITGDLSTADMLLLKSLNYSLEEVLAIRERELSRRKDEESKREESLKSWTKILYGEENEKRTRHRDKNSMEVDYSSQTNQDFENKGKKDRRAEKKSSYDRDFDFDAYNRQAVLDYENLASKLEFQQSWSDPATIDYEDTGKESKEKDSPENFRRSFDRAMEPHVVFKIRYDDSEFDSSSNSEETSKDRSPSKTSKHHVSSTLRHTTSKNTGNSFHASPLSLSSSVSSAPVRTPLPVVYQLGISNNLRTNYPKNHPYPSTTVVPTATVETPVKSSFVDYQINGERENTNEIVPTDDSGKERVALKKGEVEKTEKKVSEYEGLEWVEDDVYRVIPAFVNSLGYDNTEENETSDYEDSSNYYRQNWTAEENDNDTSEYQNDTPDSVKLFMANTNVTGNNQSMGNLSTYQQLAIAHRREGNLSSSFDSQGQKAIEDIKSRVLALTGRFNLSTHSNQVQRERLTMFSPTCQIPRNTDPDAWADPFSMNMHFQLNLTSGDHVVAAKLRIFKLPQENQTSSSSGTFEEEEEDEKKIRISIYYYTKSLKKHRSKKRLMDSVVTPLTPDGTHLALDVRQGLRFWRLNPRNSHGNGSNHGLVIQVEDQDGRPLKPALYIQQPSCADHDSDQKTSAYLHFSSEPVLVTFAS